MGFAILSIGSLLTAATLANPDKIRTPDQAIQAAKSRLKEISRANGHSFVFQGQISAQLMPLPTHSALWTVEDDRLSVTIFARSGSLRLFHRKGYDRSEIFPDSNLATDFLNKLQPSKSMPFEPGLRIGFQRKPHGFLTNQLSAGVALDRQGRVLGIGMDDAWTVVPPARKLLSEAEAVKLARVHLRKNTLDPKYTATFGYFLPRYGGTALAERRRQSRTLRLAVSVTDFQTGALLDAETGQLLTSDWRLDSYEIRHLPDPRR